MEFKERYQFDPNNDLIGKGGFSKVFKAFDRIRKKNVALKFYYGIWSDKYDIISEINRMDDIMHPNLIRYYDANILYSTNSIGENEEIQIGIMEYANYGDLSIFYKNKDLELLRKLIIDVLNGLSFLHRKGIIHRDLKPNNILLTKDGDNITAKIADFGISKTIDSLSHTASSQLLGSVEYMAPESFNPMRYGMDGKIGTNSDLWSLGIIVYELIASKTPFGNRSTGMSNEQILNNILFNDIEYDASDIPQPFKQFVEICLVKDASKRVQEAETLLKILEPQVDYDTSSKSTVTNAKPETPKVEVKKGITPPKEKENSPNSKATEILQRRTEDSEIPLQFDFNSIPDKTTQVIQQKKDVERIIKEERTVVQPNYYTPEKRYLEPRDESNLDQGKKFFKQGNFILSYQFLGKYLNYTNIDTETKFYLGYMLYNGKCGGAHDMILGRYLMDTAKNEDRRLVVDLMLKYVLDNYNKPI